MALKGLQFKQMQASNQVNPIAPRANAKLVSMGDRQFLVGGLTAHKVTSDIYEMKILHQDGNHRVEWKPHKFKNNVFRARNSFGACASSRHIYIWGGLETEGMEQKCLSELIQVDIEKSEMRLLPLAENIQVHSSSLMFDNETNELLAFGGTDATSSLQAVLYTLKIEPEAEQYEWKRARLDCEHHKGYLWQHTSHLSGRSYFTGAEGRFITTIGGCRYPYSPYNCIVEFDLAQMKMTNSVFMKSGLVSHDSYADKETIVIFGGANGGGFNEERVTLKGGAVSYEKGPCAVGCSCWGDEQCWVVLGGVCGPENMNHVIIYPK